MDSIANFVSCLVVGIKTKLRLTKCKSTKKTLRLAATLFDLGLISGYTLVGKQLQIRLRYTANNKSALRRVTQISKQSCKVYWGAAVMRNSVRERGGMHRAGGFVILTTSSSSSFLTNVECHMLKVGGEPLIRVA
jgi:ribosomal protein S8